MNLQKAYSDSIGRKPKEELPSPAQSPAEDATKAQVVFNWLESTVTQKMFSDLTLRYNTLVEQAISAACLNRTQETTDKVINLLIRADEIKNTIETYATHRS